MLREFGAVHAFGRSFPVMRIAGLEADFTPSPKPSGDFAAAARRRDLTINAIGLDPLTGEMLDPLGGRADLAARVLRAADARTFGSDPLRGLRVVQLAARFALEPDAELRALCAGLDLSGLPGERVKVELDKLLLPAPQPSKGLELCVRLQMLRFFAELAALVARKATSGPRRCARSTRPPRCARAGADERPLPVRRALSRFRRAPTRRAASSSGCALRTRSSARCSRSSSTTSRPAAPARERIAEGLSRLARRLAEAHVSPALLERVARADCWGRTTPEARARRFEAGDRFLAAIAALEIPAAGPAGRGARPAPARARVRGRPRVRADPRALSGGAGRDGLARSRGDPAPRARQFAFSNNTHAARFYTRR